MKQMLRVMALHFIILNTVILCSAQQTDYDKMQDGKVHLDVMPYLIIPGMSGSVELKGLTEDINVNAGDIFSHLQFGFMAQTQVSYNRMFLGTDTVYMGLGGANDQVNVGIDQWEAELLGGYYVQKHIAFLSGVRYNSLTGDFKFKGPDQANMRDGDVWWDPFVGGKVKLPPRRNSTVLRGLI